MFMLQIINYFRQLTIIIRRNDEIHMGQKVKNILPFLLRDASHKSNYQTDVASL